MMRKLEVGLVLVGLRAELCVREVVRVRIGEGWDEQVKSDLRVLMVLELGIELGEMARIWRFYMSKIETCAWKAYQGQCGS